MKTVKTLTLALVITTTIFSGCNSNPAPEEGNREIPTTKDPQAKEKAAIHNKTAETTHKIGQDSRELKNTYSLFHDPTIANKPTKEELNEKYQSIFNKSEELRKNITQLENKSEVKNEFESKYLPALNELLTSFNNQLETPDNKENFDKITEKFNTYYTAHNNFVEILNRNIYY